MEMTEYSPHSPVTLPLQALVTGGRDRLATRYLYSTCIICYNLRGLYLYICDTDWGIGYPRSTHF